MNHSNTAYQSKDQNAIIKNIPYNATIKIKCYGAVQQNSHWAHVII